MFFTTYSAVLSGQPAVIKLLLSFKVDFEATDCAGRSPLLCAVTAKQTATAKLLLEAGADVMTRDHDMRSCLHVAIENSHSDMTFMLLEGRGKELIDKCDYRQRTPLHYASYADDVKVGNSKINDAVIQ